MSEVMYGLGDCEDSSPPLAPNPPNDTGEDARIEAMFGWLLLEPDNYTEILHKPRTSKRAVDVQATPLPGMFWAFHRYWYPTLVSRTCAPVSKN